MGKHILKVSSTDRKGLVASITKVLHDADLNILKNHEFVDLDDGLFFMRSEVSGKVNTEKLIPNTKVVINIGRPESKIT